MSTETIIKVGGITQGTKELSIKKKGPHVAIGGGSSSIGGEDYIGGEDFIGGGSGDIHRDIKGL